MYARLRSMFKLLVLLLLLCSWSASQPEPALYELLDLLHISHEKTLPSVVQATQKEWYQSGKERWEMDQRFEEQKEAALPLLAELGCIKKISASKQHYDYAVFLGALVPRMKQRLQTLVEEYERGVRFDHLVFLTGERPLDPVLERDFLHLNTESEALLSLYEALPDGLKSLPYTFIHTPMIADAQGKLHRPNAADNIINWLKLQPAPGSCLALGNQPYVCYLNAVLKTYLSEEFTIETIGDEANLKLSLAIFLDNLARTLYQETHGR